MHETTVVVAINFWAILDSEVIHGVGFGAAAHQEVDVILHLGSPMCIVSKTIAIFIAIISHYQKFQPVFP